MPDLQTLFLFVGASVVLLVTPGPAIFYIVARSIDQGRKAGLVSVAGINVGTLVHIAVTAAGFSAIVASSLWVLTAVKFLGAAYLVYLGISKLLAKEEARTEEHVPPEPYKKVFLNGVVVNVLNPKTALFIFAFIPQFVAPERGPVAAQIIFWGLTYIATALCVDSMYALAGGTVGQKLQKNPRAVRLIGKISGIVYVSLGLLLATSNIRVNRIR